jgi:hypothetical protein
MAGGLKKSKDEIVSVIQEDVVISQEVAHEIEILNSTQDKYAMPEMKSKKAQEQVVVSPGHSRRDFRS